MENINSDTNFTIQDDVDYPLPDAEVANMAPLPPTASINNPVITSPQTTDNSISQSTATPNQNRTSVNNLTKKQSNTTPNMGKTSHPTKNLIKESFSHSTPSDRLNSELNESSNEIFKINH